MCVTVLLVLVYPQVLQSQSIPSAPLLLFPSFLSEEGLLFPTTTETQESFQVMEGGVLEGERGRVGWGGGVVTQYEVHYVNLSVFSTCVSLVTCNSPTCSGTSVNIVYVYSM